MKKYIRMGFMNRDYLNKLIKFAQKSNLMKESILKVMKKYETEN